MILHFSKFKFTENLFSKSADSTVEAVAQTLKDSPMNQYDKGDKREIYTLTADINNIFKRDVQIVPIK